MASVLRDESPLIISVGGQAPLSSERVCCRAPSAGRRLDVQDLLGSAGPCSVRKSFREKTRLIVDWMPHASFRTSGSPMAVAEELRK